MNTKIFLLSCFIANILGACQTSKNEEIVIINTHPRYKIFMAGNNITIPMTSRKTHAIWISDKNNPHKKSFNSFKVPVQSLEWDTHNKKDILRITFEDGENTALVMD
jgi:hypothetical protein